MKTLNKMDLCVYVCVCAFTVVYLQYSHTQSLYLGLHLGQADPFDVVTCAACMLKYKEMSRDCVKKKRPSASEA